MCRGLSGETKEVHELGGGGGETETGGSSSPVVVREHLLLGGTGSVHGVEPLGFPGVPRGGFHGFELGLEVGREQVGSGGFLEGTGCMACLAPLDEVPGLIQDVLAVLGGEGGEALAPDVAVDGVFRVC